MRFQSFKPCVKTGENAISPVNLRHRGIKCMIAIISWVTTNMEALGIRGGEAHAFILFSESN